MSSTNPERECVKTKSICSCDSIGCVNLRSHTENNIKCKCSNCSKGDIYYKNNNKENPSKTLITNNISEKIKVLTNTNIIHGLKKEVYDFCVDDKKKQAIFKAIENLSKDISNYEKENNILMNRNQLEVKSSPPTLVNNVAVTYPNTNSMAQINEQVTDISYQKAKESTSTYESLKISPKQDIFQRIREAYKACSCKVCECIIGKPKNRIDSCKCKPCDCNDCAGNIKAQSYDGILRMPCTNCVKCNAIECKCLETEAKKKSIQEKYSWAITQDRLSSFNAMCDCTPCQCIQCKFITTYPAKPLVVAPISENVRDQCTCSPCDCVHCARNYTLTPMRHEMSTAMSRHLNNCRCSACTIQDCLRGDTGNCACDSRRRLMKKPITRDTKDYDVHRVSIVNDGTTLKEDSTMTMYSSLLNSAISLRNKMCKCDTCECLVCSESSQNETNSNNATYHNSTKICNVQTNCCKCLPCECVSCTSNKVCNNNTEEYVNKLNKKECKCGNCDCIQCENMSKPSTSIRSNLFFKPKTVIPSKKKPCKCKKSRYKNCRNSKTCAGDTCRCVNNMSSINIDELESNEIIYPIKKSERLSPSMFLVRSLLDLRSSKEKNIVHDECNLKYAERKPYSKIFSDDIKKEDSIKDKTSEQNFLSADSIKPKIKEISITSSDFQFNNFNVKYKRTSRSKVDEKSCNDSNDYVSVEDSISNISKSNHRMNFYTKTNDTWYSNFEYDYYYKLPHDMDSKSVYMDHEDINVHNSKPFPHPDDTTIKCNNKKSFINYPAMKQYIQYFQPDINTLPLDKMDGMHESQTRSSFDYQDMYTKGNYISFPCTRTILNDSEEYFKRITNVISFMKKTLSDLNKVIDNIENPDREFQSISEFEEPTNDLFHSTLHCTCADAKKSTGYFIDNGNEKGVEINSDKSKIFSITDIYAKSITENGQRGMCTNISAHTISSDISIHGRTIADNFICSQINRNSTKCSAEFSPTKTNRNIIKTSSNSGLRIDSFTKSNEHVITNADHLNSKYCTMTEMPCGNSHMVIENLNGKSNLTPNIYEKIEESMKDILEDVLSTVENVHDKKMKERQKYIKHCSHYNKLNNKGSSKAWPSSVNAKPHALVPISIERIKVPSTNILINEGANSMEIIPNICDVYSKLKNISKKLDYQGKHVQKYSSSKSLRDALPIHYEYKHKMEQEVKAAVRYVCSSCRSVSIKYNKGYNAACDMIPTKDNSIQDSKTNDLSSRKEVQSQDSTSTFHSLKVGFPAVRKISDHSVLVKWDPPSDLTSVLGYELLVDGLPVKKKFSATSTMAVVTCLPRNEKVLLTVRTIVSNKLPHTPPYAPSTTVVYESRSKL